MTSTNGTALRASIILHPDDDTPRLVYADYLDEIADAGSDGSESADTAEFIRAQIALTKLRHDNDGESHRIWLLYDRVNLLLYRRWAGWTLHVPQGRPLGHPGLYAPPTFHRGFISHITCPYEAWVYAADVLAWDEDQKVLVVPDYDERAEYVCDVCGNVPDEYGELAHGRGCYTQDENGGGVEYIGLPTREQPRPCPETAHPIRAVTLTTWPTWDFNLYGAALTGRTKRDQLRGGEHGRRSIAERLLELEWPNIKFDLPESQ